VIAAREFFVNTFNVVYLRFLIAGITVVLLMGIGFVVDSGIDGIFYFLLDVATSTVQIVTVVLVLVLGAIVLFMLGEKFVDSGIAGDGDMIYFLYENSNYEKSGKSYDQEQSVTDGFCSELPPVGQQFRGVSK